MIKIYNPKKNPHECDTATGWCETANAGVSMIGAGAAAARANKVNPMI